MRHRHPIIGRHTGAVVDVLFMTVDVVAVMPPDGLLDVAVEDVAV